MLAAFLGILGPFFSSDPYVPSLSLDPEKMRVSGAVGSGHSALM
jgi:hypothetical protein